MKMTSLALAAAAAVLVSVAALARQNATPTPAPNPETQNKNAVGTQLMSGTVWDYAPGRSITIKASDGKEYPLPLQSNVRVDGTIVVGQLAAVMWTSDTGGATRVMSITGPPGSPADIERSAPSVGGAPPATAVPNVTPKVAPPPRPTPAP